MKKELSFLTVVFLSCIFTTYAQTPNLNSAANFDLFTALGDITNTGNTQFTGSIGTNNGTVSGFGASSNPVHIQDSFSESCALDVANLYNQLQAMASTITNHAAPFGGGEILAPGVYDIAGASSLNGTLTLNGQGNPNALFIFKIGGAFTTGAYSQIILTNGTSVNNVFYYSCYRITSFLFLTRYLVFI